MLEYRLYQPAIVNSAILVWQHFSPLVSKFGNTSSNKVANRRLPKTRSTRGNASELALSTIPLELTLPSHGRNGKHDLTEVEAKKRSVMPQASGATRFHQNQL